MPAASPIGDSVRSECLAIVARTRPIPLRLLKTRTAFRKPPAHAIGFDGGNFKHIAEEAAAFVPRHRGEFSRHRADVIDGGPAIRLALLWHSSTRVHVCR